MTLRRRLTLAFVASALAAAACFSLLGMVFVYTVEDSFLDRMLEQEARGSVTALRSSVTWHRQRNELPPDLVRQVKAGVERGEFFGESGRHYHLRKAGDGYLVAEVGKELVVRPMLPTIVTMLGGLALILALLVGGIGYVLARRATAPLERLARLFESSGEARLPQGFGNDYGKDEVGSLARALDGAMRRTASFVEREQQFSRSASHELRTPLAVIDGAARLMEAEPLTDQGRAQLQRILEASASMLRATETLLALSREDLAPAAHAPVCMLPLIEAAIVRHAPLLDSKAVEIVVDVAPDAMIDIPAGVLEILLANIVGNAFTHCAAGVIRFSVEDGALVVANGGDLADGLAARLFTPGAKGPASNGHGLGLSIAQSLALRAGYCLEVVSRDGRVSTTLKKQ